MKKRVLSVFLALIMVLCLVPETALALDSEEEALQRTFENGGNWKLPYSFVMNGDVEIPTGKTVNFDFNGSRIFFKGDICINGALTVFDSSDGKNTLEAGCGITIQAGGSLTLNSGTIYVEEDLIENFGTIYAGDGTFNGPVTNNGTITGGTYTGTVRNNSLIYATANVTGSVTYDNTAGNVITYKIGENKYAEQFVKTDSTAVKPAIDPTQAGYIFGGWYTDPECTTAFDFENTPVTTAITLYGKMIECDHTGNTNALSCTEDTTCSVCSGTIKAAHLLCWKADATHYWQECSREGCDYTTVNNKKEIPTIEIRGKDKVHTDQDYTFSFTLSDGLTFPEAGYEFTRKGAELTAVGTGSPYTVTLEARWYDLNDTQFKIYVHAITADGYMVTATKTVGLLAEHELTHTPAKAATTAEAGNKEYWYCDVCEKYFSDADATTEIADGIDGVLIPKLPAIIKGDGQTVTSGEKKALEFTSDADFAEFIRVEVDGKTLDGNNYTASEGSTVVTLKADYVAGLSVGEHTLGIVSESGTATARFTVNAKPAAANTTTTTATTANQTGDSSHMILWIGLAVICAGAVTAVTVSYKRRQSRR